MTSGRAFWKALGTGTIISFVMWSALFLAFTSRDPQFVGPYLLCALVTLMVIVPVSFRSYRRGGLPLRKEKPLQLVFAGIVFIFAGVTFGIDAYFSNYPISGWRLLLRYGAALGWVIAGTVNFVRALRLRRSNDSASIS